MPTLGDTLRAVAAQVDAALNQAPSPGIVPFDPNNPQVDAPGQAQLPTDSTPLTITTAMPGAPFSSPDFQPIRVYGTGFLPWLGSPKNVEAYLTEFDPRLPAGGGNIIAGTSGRNSGNVEDVNADGTQCTAWLQLNRPGVWTLDVKEPTPGRQSNPFYLVVA